MSQEDELFGNDSDSSECLEIEEENGNTYNNIESDIDDKDEFDNEDFFGFDNVDYSKTQPFPTVKCPGEKIISRYEYYII
jgi:hypothetical protein